MNKKVTPLVKSPGQQKTESFKRPNHSDFWDTSECKKNKLTGIRKNDMVLQWEFWILGNIEKTVSFQEVANDPQALNKAHCELFAMNPLPDTFKH